MTKILFFIFSAIKQMIIKYKQIGERKCEKCNSEEISSIFVAFKSCEKVNKKKLGSLLAIHFHLFFFFSANKRSNKDRSTRKPLRFLSKDRSVSPSLRTLSFFEQAKRETERVSESARIVRVTEGVERLG